MAIFLGIDPGLAATGVAMVEGSGMAVYGYSYDIIRTEAKHPVARRLNRIFEGVRQSLDRIRPDAVMVEDVFSLARYPKSGITLGQVTGLVLLAAHRSEIAVHEIAVREVKQILTGNGNAGKKQLEQSVRRRLGSPQPIRPSHASDALALALIGLYRSGAPVSAFSEGEPQSGGRR